mmetsp:Transcript_12467/g.18297  ORF Transcript_12467/g.18297 Transcript_12467/m.18297 type:complete len:213 (+) Transcript_12467:263-901(+)|eukprot:CAMPEP_0194207626 /NCGR_PEP_ID=MMETSP0156-20130528/6308_1 /TAXON_ID=33649 /ORGANISM="Thalassionema nitzschioides, Strain L26-B" /LENGTH=212 /DNA_ID=CAMNT_0038934425 /DNA_START=220 /DNA_END=858 /DNA_ORIENTATION=-
MTRTMMYLSFIAVFLAAKHATSFSQPSASRQLSQKKTTAMNAMHLPSEEDVTTLNGLFNQQITKEFAASHVYLAASIWCESHEYSGMASYMREESDEERGHALALVDFANKRDIPIELESIPAPINTKWDNLEQMWKDLLQVERDNTQSLYTVADAAQRCHDHAITTLLMPFHTEQVESEGKLKNILAKVHDENLTPGLVYSLDAELGSRKV